MTTKNIKAFLESIHKPQDTYKTVHIGGSNGKGTTAYFLYQLLRQQGLKVGLYHSPFRLERFDNIVLDEKSMILVQGLYHTYFDAMTRFELTPFEMDTAIMYIYFAHENVDIAVIEVGLGGTHDGTNVIDAELSIITSISLEHTEILGHEIESIIKAKSGIFKTHKKVIISPFIKPYERSVFLSYVGEAKATLVDIDTQYENIFEVAYLNENVLLAIQALKTLYPHAAYHRNKLEVLPFRFQYVRKHLILDGAHNLEGCEALRKVIIEKKLHPIIIISSLKTKPFQMMIDTLKSCAKDILVTHFDYPDSQQIEELKSMKDTTFIPFEQIIPYVKMHAYDTIIITGSLYFLRLLDKSIRSYLDETT